jgi:replication factor C subunit 3/5
MPSTSTLFIDTRLDVTFPFVGMFRFRFSPLKPDQIASRLGDIVEAEKVNATVDGHQALMQLASGDMRRVLNLLQSTHMAYPVVNEDTVYLTAGAALPAVIQSLFLTLFNDTFEVAYNMLSKVSFHWFAVNFSSR